MDEGREQQWLCLPIPSLRWKGDNSRDQTGSKGGKGFDTKIAEKHYHIFCDNVFTSVKLFQELHKVGVYATGTLRADRRGFPDDMKGCIKKGFKERGECNIRRSRINTNLSVCGKTPKL